MATGPDPNFDLESDAAPVGLPTHKQRKCVTRRTDKEVFDENPHFPRNQDGGAMESIDLVHIVIFYSPENYDEVEQFVNWMKNIIKEEKLDECILRYFDDSIFPPENVAKVRDIFDRAIRVLLFLTREFCNDDNLKFLSDEGIGQTRLNNDPQSTHLGKVTRSQKQYCMRPVHTMPLNGRSYRVPTGLGAVHGIDYYNREKNVAHTRRQVVQLVKESQSMYSQREKALTAAVTGSESSYEAFNRQYKMKSAMPDSEKKAQYYPMNHLTNAFPAVRERSVQPEQGGTNNHSSMVTSKNVDCASVPHLNHSYDWYPAPQKLTMNVNDPEAEELITVEMGCCTEKPNNHSQKHLSNTSDLIPTLNRPPQSSDGIGLCQNTVVTLVDDKSVATLKMLTRIGDTIIENRDSVAMKCMEQDDHSNIIERRESIATENAEQDDYRTTNQDTERTHGEIFDTSMLGSSNSANSSVSTASLSSTQDDTDTQVMESTKNRNSTSSSLDVDAALDSLSLHDQGDPLDVPLSMDDGQREIETRETATDAQIKNDGGFTSSNSDARPLKSDNNAELLKDGKNGEPLKNDSDAKLLKSCSGFQPLKNDSDAKLLKSCSGFQPLKSGSDDASLMTNPTNVQDSQSNKGQIPSAYFANPKTGITEINKTTYSDDGTDILENVLHSSGPAKAPVAKCAATSMSDFPDTSKGPNMKTERVVHYHQHFHHYLEKEEKKKEKFINITGCNVVQLGPNSKILTTNVGQDQTEAQFLGPLNEKDSLDESVVTPDSATTWNNLSSEESPTWPSDGDCIPKQMKDTNAWGSDSDKNNETKDQKIEVNNTENFTGDLDNLPSGYDDSYTVGKGEDLLATKTVDDKCDSNGLTDIKDHFLDEKLNFEPSDLCNEITNYETASVSNPATVTAQDNDLNQSVNAPCQSTSSGPVQDIGNGEHINIKAKVMDNFKFRGGSYLYQKQNKQCNYSGLLGINHAGRSIQNIPGKYEESPDEID